MAGGSPDVEPSDDAEDFHGIMDLRFAIEGIPDVTASKSKIGNPKSKMSQVVHAKDCVGVVFVSDLVHWFVVILAHIKSVRAIDYDAINQANVLVGMHDAPGNDHCFRFVDAGHQRQNVAIGLGVGTVVPHAASEMRGPDKTEEISLIDVLVWPAGDARERRGNISHHGEKLSRELIMAKKLSQPSAAVVKLAQIADDDILNLARLEGIKLGRRFLLHVFLPDCWHRFWRPDLKREANSQRSPHHSTSLRVRPRPFHRVQYRLFY